MFVLIPALLLEVTSSPAHAPPSHFLSTTVVTEDLDTIHWAKKEGGGSASPWVQLLKYKIYFKCILSISAKRLPDFGGEYFGKKDILQIWVFLFMKIDPSFHLSFFFFFSLSVVLGGFKHRVPTTFDTFKPKYSISWSCFNGKCFFI